MRTILLSFSLAFVVLGQEYVPGTPGAPWSKDEALVVKAKLYSMFKGQAKLAKLDKKAYGKDAKPAYFFSERKVLRLGFHDCLKYKDGTGGCDGCLNWQGVNEVKKPWGKKPGDTHMPDAFETNNRGLGNTVKYLEKVYTDPNYPQMDGLSAPALNVSLKASGKSRADLWAFAVITALEYAIENNDLACDMSDLNKVCRNSDCSDWYYRNCNYRAGQPDCKIQLPRPVQFQTGRKDCTEFGDEGYKATKAESHPDQQGDGKATVDFFVKDFGFTGREIVAIMGSHTVGKFHWQNSYMNYVWTARGTTAFNNHYYMNIAKVPMGNIQDKTCTVDTDAEGRFGPARYVTLAKVKMRGGGPVSWINAKYRCDCTQVTNSYKAHCCQNVPEGHQCIPDADTFEEDPNPNGGCESFRQNLGQDDIAMNHEMGLYLDFKVQNGMPVGCPGFETYDSPEWQEFANRTTPKERSDFNMRLSRVAIKPNADPYKPGDWKLSEVGCGKNKMEVPEGSTPLHEIFEEYAHDQQKWVDDYVPTFEKMLANGYGEGELVNGPDQYTGVYCPRDSEPMICHAAAEPHTK